MATLEELTSKVAAQSSVEESVACLLGDLAGRIKATSNDQNIQKLARELRATTPALVRLIAGKPVEISAGKTLAN